MTQTDIVSMDAETLEALKGSIAKWEKVVSEGTKGTNWNDCPLCLKFYQRSCDGCPVRVSTGLRVCAGSPFEEYEDALYNANLDRSAPPVIAAARKELDFLKSLLPKQEPST